MDADIKLDNNNLHLEGDYAKCRARDFKLDNPGRRKSEAGERRALVHDFNDGLTLNFGGDYPGGVTIVNGLTIRWSKNSPQVGSKDGQMHLVPFDPSKSSADVVDSIGLVHEIQSVRLLIRNLLAAVEDLKGRVGALENQFKES